MKKLVPALFATLFIQSIFGLTITRGPYLQVGTPTSITLRWRTDVASNSQVNYGIAVDSLLNSKTDSTLTTEHVVTLTGLSPNTKYYYSIGSTSGVLEGNNTEYCFTTSPVAGTAKSTRIWVIGDAGTGTASQMAVRDAYKNFTGTRVTDLWLQLGDNAYNDGLDAEYQAKCFNIYSNMFRKSVSWPTIGNHDAHTTNVYFSIFSFPLNGEAGGIPSGTKAYYSFDYGNIHLICLASSTSSPALENSSVGSPQWLWLSNDLASTSAKWIIAYWHHPPYTRGSHNSDTPGISPYAPREIFLPLLEQGGVDIVLCGHSHSYERSFFIDGHYGLSTTFNPSIHIKEAGSGNINTSGGYSKPSGPHNGTVYAVPGSSGQLGGGILNHPAMYTSQNVLGSMVLDVNGDQLDAKFITNTGTTNDQFSIIKSSNPWMTISPTSASLLTGGTQQFTATARDQFGNTLPGPTTWSFSGSTANGSINSSGLFTAGTSAGGPFNIIARNGSLAATGTVTIATGTTVVFQQGLMVEGSIYTSTIDTYIDSIGAATNTVGNSARLDINFGASENRQSLIRFNISTIPTNATITAASLKFFVPRINNIDANEFLNMNKVLTPWTESTTWGAGAPTSIPSGVTMPDISGFVVSNYYTVSTGLKNLVQQWVATPTSNHGVLLYSTNTLNFRLTPREDATLANRPSLTVTYQIAAVSDSDSDGLPDSWEMDNFNTLSYTGANDFDGDGFSNLQEYSTGTNPTDRGSRATITAETFSGSFFNLQWPSSAGKNYQVEFSSNLITWTFATNISGSGSVVNWIDTGNETGTAPSAAQRRFYRIKIP